MRSSTRTVAALAAAGSSLSTHHTTPHPSPWAQAGAGTSPSGASCCLRCCCCRASCRWSPSTSSPPACCAPCPTASWCAGCCALPRGACRLPQAGRLADAGRGAGAAGAARQRGEQLDRWDERRSAACITMPAAPPLLPHPFCPTPGCPPPAAAQPAGCVPAAKGVAAGRAAPHCHFYHWRRLDNRLQGWVAGSLRGRQATSCAAAWRHGLSLAGAWMPMRRPLVRLQPSSPRPPPLRSLGRAAGAAAEPAGRAGVLPRLSQFSAGKFSTHLQACSPWGGARCSNPGPRCLLTGGGAQPYSGGSGQLGACPALALALCPRLHQWIHSCAVLPGPPTAAVGQRARHAAGCEHGDCVGAAPRRSLWRRRRHLPPRRPVGGLLLLLLG